MISWLLLRISLAPFLVTTTSSLLVPRAVPYSPSPFLSQIDSLFLESRLGAPGEKIVDIGVLVKDCHVGPTGRESPPAERVRLAFHDVTTHNADAGTGGLDASIIYELDRDDNTGRGLALAVNDYVELYATPHLSRADLIAIGAVISVAECKGPLIPFRAGRVDALVPGPEGAPRVEQTIEEHIAIFRRQGFTQEEMITLTACGHSMGGVRHIDFPNIVSAEEVALPFDVSFEFDNAVVTEYLSGTTRNPLVVGRNATTNSDLRVFSSDRNVTIQTLSSTENFMRICGSVFEKMLNIVPRGVRLTEVLEPMQNKVSTVELTLDTNGLRLFTSLRILRGNSQQRVTLYWEDKVGGCSRKTCFASPSSSESVSTAISRKLGLTPVTHYFNVSISPIHSISKFWFTMEEQGTTATTIDNGGTGPGYNIRDQVIYVPQLSSAVLKANDMVEYNLIAAVKTPQRPSFLRAEYVNRASLISPLELKSVDFEPSTRLSGKLGYTFYQAKAPILVPSTTRFTFDLYVGVDGEEYREYSKRGGIITRQA